MKIYQVKFIEVAQGGLSEEVVVAASKVEALMLVVNEYKVYIVKSVERVKE